MLFEYDDGEEATVNVWCQGKVVSIVNRNKNVVEIKWKEEGINDSDQKTSV